MLTHKQTQKYMNTPKTRKRTQTSTQTYKYSHKQTTTHTKWGVLVLKSLDDID